MAEFNQALADIYKVIHPINAKNVFVTYLNETEKTLLEKSDLLTLKLCVQKLKKLLDWKKQQILGLVSKANQRRINTFIDEIKKDNRTMMIIKKAICSEIIKRIKTEFSGEELKSNPVYAKYDQYLQKLNWIFQQENRIIEHIVQSLKKGKGFAEKKKILMKIQSSLISKISDKELNNYVASIFAQWTKYYTFMQERVLEAAAGAETAEAAEVSAGKSAEKSSEETVLPGKEDEALLFSNNQETFMPEDEEATLLSGNHEDMLNLPDFGEEDDAYMDKLAEMDNAGQIVREIDALPVEKQEKMITEISFDPRFDAIYEEIISLKGDMGYFLGSLMKRVKEIETKYGYTASEDFLNDLMTRIKSQKGADNLLVKRIRNCLNNLQAIHERTTKKLGVLKIQLSGKSVLDQVKILQEMAKDKSYKAIFGTVRNLERIALESHFDEIFAKLPAELQKVVAEGFMTDLKELKAYYPDLLKKLENKIRDVENRVSASYVDTHDVDYAFIDNLLDTLPDEPADIIGDLSRIAAGIQESAGEESDYRNLGKLMAGDKKHTPADLILALEEQNINENSRIAQIIEVISDIEKLPSLNQKISTIHFWLDKHFYKEQPEIETFLQAQLEELEQKKIREGGLLRRIFDTLAGLKGFKDKLKFLETVLADPEYVHLKSTIQNLMHNLKTDFKIPKGVQPEQFILGEVEKIPNLEEKADWLKIRKAHPDYSANGEFIDNTIHDIENKEAGAITEKLEEDLALHQAGEKIRKKKEQGEKPVIHENIITLARAVLKLDNKLERRKMILEQEGLLPLEDHNLYYKQRRLLFYLFNTEPGEKPAVMVKSLAAKMLLSREEKMEYFKILKLSRFKSGDKILTLQEELGISDEDLAFYAADILAWNKQSPERKLDYFEKLRDGKIRLDDLLVAEMNEKQGKKKYLDFFRINPQVINKLITHYQQMTTARKEAQSRNEILENTEAAVRVAEPGTEALLPEEKLAAQETVPDEVPETLPELADELPEQITENAVLPGSGALPGKHPAKLPVKEKGEAHLETPEDFSYDTTDENPPEDMQAASNAQPGTGEALPAEAISKKKEKPAAKAKITEKNAGSTGDTGKGAESRITVDVMKPDTEEYDLYMKNKIKIDEFVKQQLEEKAREKSQDIEEKVKEEINKAQKEYKRNTGGKVRSIIRNLNSCQPEIIAELINHTIIPLLMETNDTATMDLIAALNQNLFTPTLYTGANIDLKTVINSIESFLHVEGIFKDCHNDLAEVMEKLKVVRGKYINTAVENEMHQIAALNKAAQSGDIDNILKNLLKVEPPLRIVQELEERYMEPMKDKPAQKSLYSRLQFLKDLIVISKKIEWGKGDTFKESTKQILLMLREKYQGALHVPSPAQIGKAAGKTPDPVEKELINAAAFVNPLLFLKTVLKKRKIEMTNEAQLELVNRLAGEGKIFSYDKKLYIGYGKLYGYLNDKNNIGYSKNKLAGELIKFLGRFGEKQDKAAFIGIPGGQFDEFFEKLEYWANHSDAVAAEHKPQNPQKAAVQLKKVHAAAGAGEKKEPKQSRAAAARQHRQEKTKQAAAAAHKPAANKELLMKLNKMITDKLLFLIKESASRDMLAMLYQSYLDPKAKKSNLFVLIDRDKFQRLYDSMKEDKALHDRLSFDADLVKKAYKKKISKMK